MELIIHRHEWLRGEGGRASYLLRPSDNKLCCVGIYLRELGVPPEQLLGAHTAEDVDEYTEEGKRVHIERLPAWLFEDQAKVDAVDDIGLLYGDNDDVLLTPEVREASVRRLFAKHNVKVEFEDGPCLPA